MKKVMLQGLLLALGAFMIWLAFSQIDFMKLFRIKENSLHMERQLGELIWDDIAHKEDIITNDSLVKTLDKLVDPICLANHIERDSLKIHLVLKDEMNAFALPNNHLVVYTGLIQDCKKAEALQGVIGHEIAHLEKRHVMKKLSKEVGFSVLLSAAAGEGGGRLLKEIFKTLSSSAYDRSLEKEADITSVDYLIKAQVDPRPMADLMYQIAQDQRMPEGFSWITDHPESEERAKYILDYLRGKNLKSKPVITAKEWASFQRQIKAQ